MTPQDLDRTKQSLQATKENSKELLHIKKEKTYGRAKRKLMVLDQEITSKTLQHLALARVSLSQSQGDRRKKSIRIQVLGLIKSNSALHLPLSRLAQAKRELTSSI